MGADPIRDYADKFDHFDLGSFFDENLINFTKKHWDKYVNSANEDLIDEEGFDLLDKMLVIDHTQRITARDAIQHAYFDSIRAKYTTSTPTSTNVDE